MILEAELEQEEEASPELEEQLLPRPGHSTNPKGLVVLVLPKIPRSKEEA